MTNYATILTLPLALSACLGSGQSGPHPAFVPAHAPETTIEWKQNGTTYRASAGNSPLNNGSRASMVGDVLTMMLVEHIPASQSGEPRMAPQSTGSPTLPNPGEINPDGNSSISAGGQAARSNNPPEAISVTVTDIYLNGTVKVEGKKLLNLTRGEEPIHLSGIIRIGDINSNHHIFSSRITDVKIINAGSGGLNAASKQRWLQRFFPFTSPF